MIVVAIVGGGIWLWEDVLQDRLIPKRWGVVEPGVVYRSGCLDAALVKSMLAKHNIQMIIDLTGEKVGDRDQEAEKAAAAELGIEIRRYPMAGNGTGKLDRYADAIASLTEAYRAKKPVLVHCAAGSQRTGGVVTCFRLLVQQKPVSQAYQEMQQYDWDPVDNAILPQFLNQNMAEIAALLVERGVIEEVPDPLPVVGP